jgi:hypothetical protein
MLSIMLIYLAIKAECCPALFANFSLAAVYISLGLLVTWDHLLMCAQGLRQALQIGLYISSANKPSSLSGTSCWWRSWFIILKIVGVQNDSGKRK